MTDSIENNRKRLDSNAVDVHSNSECPLCFNRFHSSLIESHAANCDGKSASKGLSEGCSKQLIGDSKSMRTENLPAKKSPMSFFARASPCTKRLSTSQENQNGTTGKKIKASCELRNNLTTCSKEKSKQLRRPLADEMRPTNLSDYLGQEDVIGKDGNGFWRPIFESISLPGASAIPSMIFWVS